MRNVVGALLASVLMMVPAASSADGDIRPCHAYRVTMRTARDALAQGDRATALTALRQAQALLKQCRREEARNVHLLAAVPTTTRDT